VALWALGFVRVGAHGGLREWE
jgi:hypothetical protein